MSSNNNQMQGGHSDEQSPVIYINEENRRGRILVTVMTGLAAVGVFKGLIPMLTPSSGIKKVEAGGVLSAAATGIYLAGSSLMNREDKSGKDKQRTYRLLATLMCGVSTGAATAAYVGPVRDQPAVEAADTTAPSKATGLDNTSAAVLALNLGGDTICEIAPYLQDEDDMDTEEAKQARDISTIILKKYLTETGDYTGDLSADVTQELSEAVDSFQGRMQLDVSQPWNIYACEASELGDGIPGPYLGNVEPVEG